MSKYEDYLVQVIQTNASRRKQVKQIKASKQKKNARFWDIKQFNKCVIQGSEGGENKTKNYFMRIFQNLMMYYKPQIQKSQSIFSKLNNKWKQMKYPDIS